MRLNNMGGIKMQRGNLVIYDLEGTIVYQTGEAEGNILPHEYPVGIPYMEIPFGTMKTKRLIRIDTTVEPHEPIFEDVEKITKTPLQTAVENGVITKEQYKEITGEDYAI